MRPRLSIRQRSNNVTQSTQRLIDFLTFLKPLTRCLRYSNSLTSRQIDQIKLSDFNLLGSIFAFILISSTENSHLLHNDNKDSMGPRGEIVHLGGGSCSALGTLLHQGIDFIGRSHCPLAKPFDENTFLLVFSDLERSPLNLQEI